jgi:hypothetical protein
MEPADHNRDPRLAELAGQVKRARVLVRLDTDQTNHAETIMASNQRVQLVRPNPRVRFINRFDIDCHVGSENAPGLGLLRQPIQSCQRV